MTPSLLSNTPPMDANVSCDIKSIVPAEAAAAAAAAADEGDDDFNRPMSTKFCTEKHFSNSRNPCWTLYLGLFSVLIVSNLI